jgi:hypothetical protein
MLFARISRLCIEGNKLYVAAVYHVHNAMLIFLDDHCCEGVAVAPSSAGVPFMLGFFVNLRHFPTCFEPLSDL